MKFRKLLGGGLLAAVLALGGVAGLATHSESKSVGAAGGWVECTKITLYDYKDGENYWCFRTLWLNNIQFSSGYEFSDLDVFLDDYYGDSVDSWNPQSTTRSYHRYGNGTNLCSGGDSGTYVFELPWWVTDCDVEAQNNSNNYYCGKLTHLRKYSNNDSEFHDGSYYKKKIHISAKNWGANINVEDETAYAEFGEFNVTKYAVDQTGTSIKTIGTSSVCKYDKIADPEIIGGYIFDGWYTSSSLTDTAKSLYLSGDPLYAKYNQIFAQFLLEGGTLGDTLTYNNISNEFEGVIDAGSKFKVRKTVGETYNDYYALKSGVSEDIAVVEGEYVVVKAAYPVMVYLDNAINEMWVTAASGELIAYAYAGYFLSYVGCDNSGKTLPSGWTTVKDRYESAAVTDDARNYIYNFDVSTAKADDNIAAMIVRYNLACTNHPTLDRFIKDSGGNVRPITKVSTNPISIFGSADSSAPIMLVVIISVASLTAVGGYIFLKRRKED